MSETETTYPHKSGDFTILGPECFTDGKVISYQGENYYLACPHPVVENEDSSGSFCVRRVGHAGYVHEDYHGNLRHEHLGLLEAQLVVPHPTVLSTNRPLTKQDILQLWETFVTPARDLAAREMTDIPAEVETLMALCRAINEGLPQEKTNEVK